MKKRLLRFTLSVFALSALVFSFSSCLGDSDSSYELNNNFVYVNTSDLYTYGVNSGQMAVSSEGIRSMNKGDCAIVSFKVSTSSGGSSGIFEAEEMTISQKFYSRDQASVVPAAVPDPTENTVYVKTLGFSDGTAYNFMGDRWLFNVTYEAERTAEFLPQFFYDANNQIETVGGEEVELKPNQVILDVNFTKNAVSGEKEQKSEYFVGNLHGLKNYYRADYTTTDAEVYDSSTGRKAVPVYIKFRYYKPGEETPTYLGSSWTTYCIVFYEGEEL